MGLNNILVLSQATGYGMASLMSLCVIVPISLHTDKFQGHCLLYSTGSFNNLGAIIADWASPVYCSFSIFVGILIMALSVIQLVRMSVFLYYEIDSSFFSAFLDTILCLLLTAFIFVAAVMISGGFKTWCDSIISKFQACEDASLTQLFPQTKINTFGFYIDLGTAQFGAWCSWVCWVLLTVFSMRKLCRYHEEENIRISMLRERQRLLNSGGNQSGAGGPGAYGEIES